MYETGKLVELDINDILPNRFQPRIYFNDEKLYQLAESIHKYGVIEPIVVRQVNNKYEIIAGERRYKASKLANRATIPAIIKKLTDRESEEIALLENIQRQELTPIEEAVSYKRILDMGYITQEALAKKIGKSQSTIDSKVSLLNLDDVVQEALLNGKISERHARSLLKINSRVKQREMLNRIIKERLTVKRTDEEIAKLLSSMPKESIIKKDTTSPKIALNSTFTSGPVEMLFDNEENRKDDFMDIDKTLREAKDINADNQNSQLLGTNPAAQVFNQNVAKPNNQPVQTPETPSATISKNDNKFVHYVPKEETLANDTNQANPNPTFNSIFNSTINDISAGNPNTQPEIPVVEPSISTSPIQPETSGTESSTPIFTFQPGAPVAEPAKPISPIQPGAPVVEPATPISPIQPGAPVVEPTPPISPLQPGAPVVEPTAPIQETPSSTQGITNIGANNIEPISALDSTEQKIYTPETTPKTPSSPVFEPSSPMGNVPNSINESSEPITAEPSDYKNPAQNSIASAVSAAFAAKENSQSEANNVSPWNSVESSFNPSVEMNIENTLQDKNSFNIPKADILEDNEMMNINMNPIMNPKSNNEVNVSTNNFREAIRLIRECADKIESLGYSLNVDEADLNDKYQVIFNINK